MITDRAFSTDDDDIGNGTTPEPLIITNKTYAGRRFKYVIERRSVAGSIYIEQKSRAD